MSGFFAIKIRKFCIFGIDNTQVLRIIVSEDKAITKTKMKRPLCFVYWFRKEIREMIEKIYKVMFPKEKHIAEYDDIETLKKDLQEMQLPLALLDFPDDDTLLESSEVYKNECGGCKVWIEVHDYR